MRGKKFSSPRDTNNSDAIAIKNVIQEIAQEEIKRFGFPTYKAAIVRKINEDGTIDCYLPPNEDNLVTGVLNKCGELLFVGDSVELETKNGSLTNCWVAIKHGTNVQGQAEEVENLSGEVVMKVQNGRLSVTELNRDAVLGNAFTIIAEDINLDGMNIVLNGSRGITITSPYFNVTSQGYITATGGKIGGWEMGATRLYSGSGANYVALDSGTSGVDYPIWAGNETASSAPFRVTRAGALTSTSGSIGGWTIGNSSLTGGNITLNSNGSISGGSTYTWSIGTNGYATFNGITATAGTIGAFTLNTTGIYSGSGGAQAGIGVYGQKYAFWAGSEDTGNAPFHVGHDGALYASNATISGNIDAGSITSGTLNVDRIPNLSAGKITSGTMSANRISGGSITGVTININNQFSVNDSGQLQLSNSNGGFLSMRNSTHPFVSALNCAVGSGGLLFVLQSTQSQSPTTQLARINAGQTGSGGKYGLLDLGTWYCGSYGDGYQIATKSGGYPSTKNLKTNLKNIASEYSNIYDDLKNIGMYTYEYKYDGIKDNKNDYGFIIDEFENSKYLSRYILNYNRKGKIINNELIKENDDRFNLQGTEIDYKDWDKDAYFKMSLILIKSLQTEIEKLKQELNSLKGGK